MQDMEKLMQAVIYSFIDDPPSIHLFTLILTLLITSNRDTLRRRFIRDDKLAYIRRSVHHRRRGRQSRCLFLPGQNVFDKLGVVDVPIGVLLSRHQTIHLILSHPFSQRGEDVAELRPHHRAVSLLVKDPQPLHKVLKVALLFGAGHMLLHGQEAVKVQQLDIQLLRLRPPQQFQHFLVGGVVSQRPHNIAALSVGDLHLAGWRLVEQSEGVFELLDLVGGELHHDALQVHLGGFWLRLRRLCWRRRLFLLCLHLLHLCLFRFHFLWRHVAAEHWRWRWKVTVWCFIGASGGLSEPGANGREERGGDQRWKKPGMETLRGDKRLQIRSFQKQQSQSEPEPLTSPQASISENHLLLHILWDLFCFLLINSF